MLMNGLLYSFHAVCLLAGTQVQSSSASQPLTTSQPVSSPPTMEESALVVDLSRVPDCTLGISVHYSYN